MAELVAHRHGKSRVRVGRVWREGATHHLAEWSVDISLLSGAEAAFTSGDNSAIVATDTIKNTVYVLAKRCTERVTAEDFAVRLAQHFLDTYSIVSGIDIAIVEKPWDRVEAGGRPHDHGFKLGHEEHTVAVAARRSDGSMAVTSGLRELAVLKTTQSGFEKFIHDQYTLLPDTRERMVATSIRATWDLTANSRRRQIQQQQPDQRRYSRQPACYRATLARVKALLLGAFYGPPSGGVYSASVQATLNDMARAVLDDVPEVASVCLNMPNIHFLPCNLPAIGVPFENDVYIATSEPHGTIEARLARMPQSRL
eukprot:SM000187S03896  [mRNA]  locus=s187:276042:277787:- [translate_table: standard]